MGTTKISAKMTGEAEPLLSGDLFGTVSSEEAEWEIKDIPKASLGEGVPNGSRELLIVLTKTGKSAGQGPLWPHLIRSDPEVDLAGVKRVEKDINELLADLQKST